MLLLPQVDPSENILEQLAVWQAEVDAEPSYATQVAKADKAWTAHRQTATLDAVEVLLSQMCCGGRRCAYCEDSLASDIEHIWPKSLYPSLVFDWQNYLYACAPCNRVKGARFAIYPSAIGTWALVSRPPSEPPLAPPPAGEMVFINPRREDPTRFFMLDVRSTFRLELLPNLPMRDLERADYTLHRLPLNDDPLCEERENEFGNYLSRLSEYLQDKNNGAPLARLERRRNALLRLRHQTVWFEMKRQHKSIPELQALFAAAPEALTW